MVSCTGLKRLAPGATLPWMSKEALAVFGRWGKEGAGQDPRLDSLDRRVDCASSTYLFI